MKMRKGQKLMIVSLLLALIAVLTVTPTLSWLSSISTPVVNTFTGGGITVTLDEALVDADGRTVTGDGAQRVTANQYKYVAGMVLDKDPTPTVLAGSEPCYVFLCVENSLSDKFALNISESAWTQVAQDGGKAVYAYYQPVDAGEADVTLQPIFTTVTVSDDLTAEDIAALGERTLAVTAWAVQTQSLTAEDAAALATAQFLPQGD